MNLEFTDMGHTGHFGIYPRSDSEQKAFAAALKRQCPVPGRGPVLGVEMEGGRLFATRRSFLWRSRWVSTPNGWRLACFTRCGSVVNKQEGK